MPPLLGGLELGGTKCLCVVATGPDDVQDELRVPTREPEATLADIYRFFHEHCQSLVGLGVGTFGPVDLRPDSPAYGTLVSGSKPDWQGVDVLEPLHGLGVPLALDTDVNAAALGESLWGAGKGCDPLLYVTVGTGIGGGVLLRGRPHHGLWHPELGHIRVQRAPGDGIQGVCPAHGDCLEGLASGPALARRWGLPAHKLPADHEAWELEAFYLAQGLLAALYTLVPRRIVLGGGVMQASGLLARVRRHMLALQAGYLPEEVLTRTIEDYLLPPGLGHRSGVLGALALVLPLLEPDPQ